MLENVQVIQEKGQNKFAVIDFEEFVLVFDADGFKKSKEIFKSISDELFDFNFSPYTDKIYEELKINII